MMKRTPLTLSLLFSLPLWAASSDLGIFVGSFLPPTLDPGDQLRLSLTVFSNGPDPADHARLTLSLPAGSTLIDVQSQFGNCVQQGNDVVCDAPPAFNSIAAVTTFTIGTPRDLAGGIFPITAHVSNDTADPNTSNNTFSTTLTMRRLLVVDSNADDGATSLRGQIANMNATCGTALPCKIVFAQEMVIEPLSPLPAITVCNSGIDAGGAAGAPLRVELRGTRLHEGSGLEIRTNCDNDFFAVTGVTIRRLAIGDFPENGIGVISSKPRSTTTLGVRHTIQECLIGTDATGTLARPNHYRGIATAAPNTWLDLVSNTISGNLCSGVAFYSIGLAGLSANRIGIGTDDRALPNGASGIFAANGDIGATNNQIAHNGQYGISTIGAPRLVNSGNIIRDNGGQPIDFGLDGPSRGGPLRPPVLVDASYDVANDLTVIRGHLGGNNDRSPQGGTFRISFAAATSRNASGFVDMQRVLPVSTGVVPDKGGDFDFPFEVSVRGDLRGQLIVGFTSYAQFPDLPLIDSTELSDAIVVH
jgi:hypothetical protein